MALVVVAAVLAGEQVGLGTAMGVTEVLPAVPVVPVVEVVGEETQVGLQHPAVPVVEVVLVALGVLRHLFFTVPEEVQDHRVVLEPPLLMALTAGLERGLAWEPRSRFLTLHIPLP